MSSEPLVLAPVLGIDNMIAAAGIAYVTRSRRIWIETCLLFGLFAGLAVVFGTSIGSILAMTLARGGHFVAAAILSALGLRLLWPVKAARTPDEAPPAVSIVAIGLLGIALSADTLGASIALGADGAAENAVPVITLGTVAMTMLGLAIGANATRVPILNRSLAGFGLILAAGGVAAGWI
ncbi:MAG TPA: manganese efflux pump [Candidatus Dormibacteraeota bacterium]|nr:manganese efflux pump [Candidatus Dormibacteraeota bacterium]